MIEYRNGNILEANAHALVNPVNTQGVMGKGLALQFAQRFPEIMAPYRAWCAKGAKPGSLMTVATAKATAKLSIINLATKDHWRNPSQLEWVEDGLKSLVLEVQAKNFGSIALPKIGCGLGGLEWAEVRPLVEHYLAPLEATVFVFGENSPTGLMSPMPKIEIVNMKHVDRNDPDLVYCGRKGFGLEGSVLGNPFPLKREADRDLIGNRYDNYLEAKLAAKDPAICAEMNRLYKKAKQRGRLKLGCWCAPKRCHCDSIRRRLEEDHCKDPKTLALAG